MRRTIVFVSALLGVTGYASARPAAQQEGGEGVEEAGRTVVVRSLLPPAAPAAAGRVLTPARDADAGPPPAWLQGDPADSLYRAAREALNRGDYRRGAELFRQISGRFPQSGYAADALYWEAFALYKVGDTDGLRQALAALEKQQSQYAQAATRGDAVTLATRIRGELARRGDAESAERVAQQARPQGDACPSEDDDMRIAALNALMQMDAERAVPILRQVLARRDKCSVQLREKAVFIVAQQVTPETADILLNVARNDPDGDVRVAAVQWLSEVKTDRAVMVLDSILRTSRDEAVQEKAIFALAEHDSPRARQLLRNVVTMAGVSDDLKRKAIFAIGHHSGEPEDAAFLRGVYGRLTTPELKETLIQSAAQIEDEPTQRWLLGLVRQKGEPIDLRKKALFWAGEGDAPVAAITALYGQLTEPEMKEHVIFVLSQSDERAATDKLIEIARKEPDRELRKKAIFWLSESDDPRVVQVLKEIINQ